MPSAAYSDELRRAIDEARRAAAEAGELNTGPLPNASPLSEPALAIFSAWVDEGGYDRAVADVIAGDPDLAS